MNQRYKNYLEIKRFYEKTTYQEIIKEATENGDPVASRIKQLKFEVNSIILLLTDPYKHLGK